MDTAGTVSSQGSLKRDGNPKMLTKKRRVSRKRTGLLAIGPVHLFYWYPFTNYSYQLKDVDLVNSFFFSETEVQVDLKQYQLRSPYFKSSSKRLFCLLKF